MNGVSLGKESHRKKVIDSFGMDADSKKLRGHVTRQVFVLSR